jgi:hypothetical protein
VSIDFGGAGHEVVLETIEAVRGDSFLAEANIHYPTESNLIGDGLRKVITLPRSWPSNMACFVGDSTSIYR